MQIVATDVVVQYPRTRRPVLEGAHLAVRQGESVAILGPSGSGKSTLLSVLGDLITPTRGTVRVEMDGQSPRPSLRDVTSWILQTTNVLPERTALDNVAIAALAHGARRPEALRDARSRLVDVGLGEHLHLPARVLSGGELQRVVIARALASKRPFLLADEPTGQLDRDTSDVVLDALFRASTSVGMVVVTHDAAVASRCDRVVHISDGAVVTA